MARVINLVRRSEGEFVIEEEVAPGQWISATHVPQAAITAEKPRQLLGIGTKELSTFFSDVGRFFKPEPWRTLATQLRPPLVAPFVTRAEFLPPTMPLVQGRLPTQAPLGVTPEQITRLVTETKIREAQIKNYLNTPIGFVFQESKKLPGVVTQVPIKRPTPPPGEIEALFPLPTIPTASEIAGFGPAPVRVFKGFIELGESGPLGPKGKRVNLWEDFAGNEVEGFRQQPGEFGQVEQILEY